MWFAEGTFDPINGEIVARELGRLEEELFAADWAEAKARVGDGVTKANRGATRRAVEVRDRQCFEADL